jgi:putative transposase
MREDVRYLMEEYGPSERHACALVGIAVMSYRYRPRRRDADLRARLIELAREKPRFGYRRLHVRLCRDGTPVNHKRVWRVYREDGLCVKRIRRKRLVRALRLAIVITAANQEWGVDFASDLAASGESLRILSVVDRHTRECLRLEVDTSLPSLRVTRALKQIASQRRWPQAIRCDNGPELTSRHFLAWCIEHKIDLVHIQPGQPTQNAHVESFHGRLCDECLNVSWFRHLFDARRKIEDWRRDYNTQRPHSALGYRTPAEFARSSAASPSSSSVPASPVQTQACGGHGSAPSPRFGC